MDLQRARSISDELARRSPERDVIMEFREVVARALLQRMPSPAKVGVALDEAEQRVVVGVISGAVISLRVRRGSADELYIETDLLRLKEPDVKVSLVEVAVGGNYEGGFTYRRKWRYCLRDGSELHVRTGPQSGGDDLAFAEALAAAAGWPTPGNS